MVSETQTKKIKPVYVLFVITLNTIQILSLRMMELNEDSM